MSDVLPTRRRAAESQQRIMDCVKAKSATPRQIHLETGLCLTTVYKHIPELVATGRIKLVDRTMYGSIPVYGPGPRIGCKPPAALKSANCKTLHWFAKAWALDLVHGSTKTGRQIAETVGLSPVIVNRLIHRELGEPLASYRRRTLTADSSPT